MRQPRDVTDIPTSCYPPPSNVTEVTRIAATEMAGLGADDERPGRSESLADIIEWLFVVFESRLGLTAVVACVHSTG